MRTKAELERMLHEARTEITRLGAQANQERSKCTQSEPLCFSESHSHCEASLSPAWVTLKDQKLDPPPKFDGKTAEYATFIGHCEFYFENKPATYLDNDKNKVNLVISCLHGGPLHHGSQSR